jgi:hypothetical protein
MRHDSIQAGAPQDALVANHAEQDVWSAAAPIV